MYNNQRGKRNRKHAKKTPHSSRFQTKHKSFNSILFNVIYNLLVFIEVVIETYKHSKKFRMYAHWSVAVFSIIIFFFLGVFEHPDVNKFPRLLTAMLQFYGSVAFVYFFLQVRIKRNKKKNK